MSYVSQRSSTSYPEWTNSSKKYYYQFVQTPQTPWNASSPRQRVTVDGDIMPKRDVNDAANDTDTWKILRGIDMYFAFEGALERWTAANQFGIAVGSWPRSAWYGQFNTSDILAWPWQWTQGNEPGASKSGLAKCYQGMWLKNIQSTSDLASKYTTWANGQTITPLTSPDAERGNTWTYYLDYAIGKWELSDMTSHYEDFAPGSPLVADNVRRVYYDLARLKWYSPHAGDGSGGRVVNINTTQWAMNSWSNTTTSPLAPTASNLVQYQTRQVYNYGEPDQYGGYWGWYPTAGEYYFPRPGKIDENGNRTDFMGDVVACYVALHLTQTGDNISQRDIYEWRKVSFSKTTDGRWVQVTASEMSNAAYQMINDNNAAVPRQMGADKMHTTVECSHINIVCQLTDRTDISQIGWTWTP